LQVVRQNARKVVLTAVPTVRVHVPIDRKIGKTIAGSALMTGVNEKTNARTIDMNATAIFVKNTPMPGARLSKVR